MTGTVRTEETAVVTTDIPRNLRDVGRQIAETARQVGRDPAKVTLVAISKTQPAERIAEALAAGHRVFGENRVQEAAGKWPDLRRRYPEAMLHLVGPLQTNKVRDAVTHFDVIETVDRPRIAEALQKEMRHRQLYRPCYVQVNTGEEPQKAGIGPDDADAFIAWCRDDVGLFIDGLMCIPPAGEEPTLHFALLGEIASRAGLAKLSMGMSGDFAAAIELGATHVRVGTAIFGPRMVDRG